MKLRANRTAGQDPSTSEVISVWGHFHGGNLGDDLVVAVLIAAIQQRRSAAQIIGVSMAPRDTRVRHALQTLPINPGQDISQPNSPDSHEVRAQSRALRRTARKVPGARRALGLWRELWFLSRSYAALRSIDQLIVAGSGQLQDASGPWTHPYTTFRWAVLARLARVEIVLPSVGVGPITSRISRLFIRKSVEWARFVSLRDEDSVRVLRAIGVRRELALCPDMAWAYVWSKPRVDPPAGATAVVGVNVMPHEDPRYWANGEQSRYDAYMTKMALFVANLLRHGDRVLLFSSQTRADRLVADDLRRDLGDRGLADHPRLEWAVDHIETVEQFVEAVSRCDYVVAARFHSVLVPLSLGIPTLALAYQPKTRELLAQVGRPARCFDIDSFGVGELEAALEKLRAEDQPRERAELLSVADRFRNAVEEQFDLLFPSQP
jgi:polysaccharide pyruvyl transferase WcaK-like protein